jgi:hypothetical protein
MHIVTCMIILKEGEDDLPLWEWLQSVLQNLGSDGMSSEESGVEGIETVYRVKILEWRRNMERELDIVDKQRLLDSDLFSPRGSKPVTRIRSPDNVASSRGPVPGLPRSFYDKKWLDRQSDNYRRMTLCVSQQQFKWFKLVAEQRSV